MRTKRTLLNMAYALGSSLLLLLLGLVTRRLLVDNFGPQITTASQVVSQLFNFFSIAEFGVGSVISYRLYEQIAAKNEEKISKYMSMYKWAYRVVGLVIAGLALIGAAAASLALRTLCIYVPFLADAFAFTAISAAEYAVAMGLAVLVIPVVELVKCVQRAVEKRARRTHDIRRAGAH